MKKFFIPLTLLFFACSKGNNNPGPDPLKEKIEKIHSTLQGKWNYNKLSEKSIWKCAGDAGCTVSNPDGTIKDTTRIEYNLTNSYWNFDDYVFSVTDMRNNNGGFSIPNTNFSLPGNGDKIVPATGMVYDIVYLSSDSVVLKSSNRGPASGNIYYAFYYTYYLTK